jgi:uncharacterized membrane protein
MTNPEPRAAQATGVDVELLKSLRHHRSKKRQRPAPPGIDAAATPGQRMADWVAAQVGSWRFILVQSTLLVLWIAINSMAWIKGWDPYPFILLNLVLSFQAAYTAPIIMMSQNRLAMVDRQHAEDDYHINVKAELEIELLHQKIDLMREKEIMRLLGVVERLEQRLIEMSSAQAPRPAAGASTPTATA